MADHTNIEWTDATVNFWWGCTKVGPGCDNCYAERFDHRTGGSHWGLDVPRRKIKSAVKLLHRLDNGYADWAATHHCRTGNARAFGLPPPGTQSRRRVFIQSMSDLFDLEVPVDWFREAWETIEACDRLKIQIVTKRISAVEKRLKAIGRWAWPKHAGLIITVVNQAEADRDVPRLLAVKKALGVPWAGLSIEPMLGPVDLAPWLHVVPRLQTPIAASTGETCGPTTADWIQSYNVVTREPMAADLDWVIVGGESGPGARPAHPDWFRAIRDQCAAAGVAFFFKRWGRWGRDGGVFPNGQDPIIKGRARCAVYDGAGEWVYFANGYAPPLDGSQGEWMYDIGKRRAGRLLDGRTHDEMPSTPPF